MNIIIIIYVTLEVYDVHALFIIGEDSSSCAIHLMNDGISIDGRNVSIHFVGIGPVESYFCRIDRSPFLPCEFSMHFLLPDRSSHAC